MSEKYHPKIYNKKNSGRWGCCMEKDRESEGCQPTTFSRRFLQVISSNKEQFTSPHAVEMPLVSQHNHSLQSGPVQIYNDTLNIPCHHQSTGDGQSDDSLLNSRKKDSGIGSYEDRMLANLLKNENGEFSRLMIDYSLKDAQLIKLIWPH